jgi:hypothetical protein
MPTLTVTATSTHSVGATVDEWWLRTDASQSLTPLVDALGSTISLATQDGQLVSHYAYAPFGATAVTGATSTNPFAYTGRELENDGTYYFRARYYLPRSVDSLRKIRNARTLV